MKRDLRWSMLVTALSALSLSCAAGDPGEKGETGATGETGTQGVQGPAGAGGPQGNQGVQGPAGEQGAAGPAGAAGSPGSTGPQGDTGTTGAQGETGATGAQGDKGDKGDKGDTGAAGADAVPCSVTDNPDDTVTISCPNSDPVTVTIGKDGKDGQNAEPISCSSKDNGDGSQTLSCTDGTTVFMRPPPTSPYLDDDAALPGIVATTVEVVGGSNADGTFAPGDEVSVTFSVKNEEGQAIPLDQLDTASIWLSGPTNNYQHILPAETDKPYYTDVATAAVYNGDGTYTYAFADAIPATFGHPLNNTSKFTDGELSGPLTAGTYTVTLNFTKKYFYGAKEVTDSGHIASSILLNHATTITPRAVVADANCAKCHNKVEGHEGKFTGIETCITCHTSGAEDFGSTDTGDATNATIDFKVMLHKLHNGAHLPSVLGVATNADGSRNYAATPIKYVVAGIDFSGIIFPTFPNFSIAMPKDTGYSTLVSTNRTKEDNIRKGVTSCADCHGDPDDDGAALAPAQGEQAYSVPTRAACGSCHDDLDYTRPYVANGQTMPANILDANCSICHTVSAGPLGTKNAHLHPVMNNAKFPDAIMAITGVSGGSGTNGAFQVGDRPVVNFTVKQGAADAPITDFLSVSLALSGPTNNRQVVMPGALAASPFDFAGRLAAKTTSNKGAMSKVLPSGASTTETLTVAFTSATAYTVSGTTSGPLGTGTLDASTSTYPTGASLSNIVIKGDAPAANITVEFFSDVAYGVKAGAATIGSGTLPANVSTVQRFTSTDGMVSFNLVVGTTAYAAGNKIYLSVFKGPIANPVAFAILSGKSAFSTGDRFYYDYIAPAASYSVKIPMDLPTEFLGTGDGTTVGQVFTAANLPVWYGRQTLFEQTALAPSSTALTASTRIFAKHLYVASITGLANSNYLLIDEATANAEYTQIGATPSGTHVTLNKALRFTHAAGATVRAVTLDTRVEGVDYTLNAANGTITLVAASANPFVLTYRTDGRFGWKRNTADTLQKMYYAPLDNSEETDETWGDWRGKAFVDGTYTFALWGYIPNEYGANNEWQTYRGTTKSSRFDVLYGAATTIQPYSLVESGMKCNTCHTELSFHGGGREGGDTCFICHSTAGKTVHFNTLLHAAHEATFPIKPNGAGDCSKCHGTSNVWQEPTNRNHPTEQVKPVRDWSVSCQGCHSYPEAVAHTDVMTAPSGAESCKICHGPAADFSVGRVHAAH